MDWLDIYGIEKRFSGVQALKEFTFSLNSGEILGLIGPNGAGKTSLFNIISGFIPPDSGKVIFKGNDITRMSPHRITNLGVSRTFQNLRLLYKLTVLENLLLAFKRQYGESLYNVFFRWRGCQEQEAKNYMIAMEMLDQVGLAGKEQDVVDELSYGQQKLVSLLCCLVADAELLLLDEPVAGIAPEMTEKILSIIQNIPNDERAVILIEHNLQAVAQICNRVLFIDAGIKVSEGSPEHVKNDPKVINAYLD